MKTFALAFATTALTATAAVAGGIGSVDQNGDNFASKAELVAVYPTLEAADFRDIDLNDDNRISNTEINTGDAAAILARNTVVEGGVLDVTDLDTDGSGFVSKAELVAAYPGLSAVDFDDIDGNDDGRVSATELYASDTQLIVSRYDAGGSSVAVALNVVDTDGSGFASFAELNGQFGGLSAVEFDRIDTNGDDRISFNELYDADAVAILGQNL